MIYGSLLLIPIFIVLAAVWDIINPEQVERYERIKREAAEARKVAERAQLKAWSSETMKAERAKAEARSLCAGLRNRRIADLSVGDLEALGKCKQLGF
jgi:hypothetical protein